MGDLAETIALVLPETLAAPADRPWGRLPVGEGEREGEGASLSQCMAWQLLPLRGQPPDQARAQVQALWARLPPTARLVATKLITGHLRVGVSRQGLVRALAEASGLPRELLAQRLIPWLGRQQAPGAADYLALLAPVPQGATAAVGGAPYPFFLAHALSALWPAPTDADPGPDSPEGLALAESLGPAEGWWAEWKWDGIRAQWVHRDGQAWLWTRGDEWVSSQYPELAPLAQVLPQGTVLDGELLAWQDGRPLPFAQLQRRLGRQRLSAALLREVPVCFMAYDLLESGGQDLRQQPFQLRRAQLSQVVAQAHASASAQAGLGGAELPLRLSPGWIAPDWHTLAAERQRARELGVEGLMLKALDSRYGVGRTRQSGLWLKWKLDPFTVDAVLVYAQAGHGRRANLYTDYTFALWDQPPGSPERRLVPVAKAYSGLTDAEIAEVDRFVRQHTLERFGPVRAVQAQLVFELGFEGVLRSTRHKSGVALRFPRMLRWRRDKLAADADCLDLLTARLPTQGVTSSRSG